MTAAPASAPDAPRVVVVASTFPASPTDAAPRFVHDQVVALARHLPTARFDVLAPHHDGSGTRDRVEHPEFTEHRFHYMLPRRFERLAGRGIEPTIRRHPAYLLVVPLFVLCEAIALWRLVRRTRATLVYAHWFSPQGIVAAMVSALTRVPFSYTSHSSDVAFLRKIPWVGGALVRRLTGRADRVTVVSTRSLAKLRSFFDQAAWRAIEPKVAVIPMGVHLTAGEDRPGTPVATRPRLVFLGRLAEKKGVQYLIPALTRLREKLDVHLVVAGDGPWSDRLRELAAAESLGPDEISFSGYVTGEAKDAVVESADVFVVPSIITDGGDAEGLPVSLLEGLAAGRVCVATNESGADDVLTDGHDGFLVPQRDVDALVGALHRAATLDPEERRRMAQAARATARAFSWPVVAARHVEHLGLG